MKKWIFTGMVTLLSLAAITSHGHAANIEQEIATQLGNKGLKHIKKVHSENDSFRDMDRNGKEYDHPVRHTLNVDLDYSSIQDANQEYGKLISELTGKTSYYKNLVGAQYLKVNIYKGDQLVAYYAIDENGERTYHINGGYDFSSLGMGFPMSQEAYENQLQVIQKAEQENK